MKLARMCEVAADLGVSRQQVHAWHKRRARNGFPEAVSVMREGNWFRALWSLEAVREWRRTYTPSRGGRPKQPVDTGALVG